MALSPWDLIDPVEATMLIRELPDDDPDPLLASLPEVTVRTNKPRWGYATRTRRSATFRAWNAESPIAQREVSLTQFEVELPPISEKIPLDEARRLELEGFDLNGTNPSIVQRLIDSAYDDVVLITDRIRNRLKLARTDVLTDGKFTLSGENGLVGLETDWSWDVAQTPTPSILWSVVATSSPLTDELAWDDWLEANSQSRSRSSIVYTTRAVVALLAQNAQYKQQLYPGISVATVPTLNPLQVNAARAQWNLPPIVVVEKSVINPAGVTQRLVPTGRFIKVVPSVGDTQLGLTVDALDLARTGAITRALAPGLIAGTWWEPDPVTRWTKVSGCGMPVLSDPNGVVSAQVTP
jgi:hypothetical protein